MRHFVTLTFFDSGSKDFSTLARILLSDESASRGVLGVACFELEALARVAFFEGVVMGEDISMVEMRGVQRGCWYVEEKRKLKLEKVWVAMRRKENSFKGCEGVSISIRHIMAKTPIQSSIAQLAISSVPSHVTKFLMITARDMDKYVSLDLLSSSKY